MENNRIYLKDKVIIAGVFLTSTVLFAFVFWLGFPGYFQEGDIYNSLSVTTNHWHPVFIARFIQLLYLLFGKHSFYLFALNIFCFYAGFFFFITGFYIKTRSILTYVLFLITLIGNIFFQNFIQYHSFTFPMLLWLGCSMVFFQLFVPITNRYLRLLMRILTTVVFTFSLLWRHNAIISVYPLLAIFVYLLLKRKHINNTARYIFRFISLMAVGAFLLAFIVKVHPHLLSKNLAKTTTNHIFLHQIAGMTVPANDASFFPQAWYEDNKNFQDVKEMYKKYPLIADPFNVGWEPWESNRPFKREELSGLKLLWFKAILKYPAHYLKHISRFYKAMWFQEPGWILNPKQIQKKPTHPWHISIASNYSENERCITFSHLRGRIYDFLFQHRILLNHIIGVKIGFAVLLISFGIWIFLASFRSDILFFSLSTSLSACCTAIMVCIFSPAPDPRYMSPVLVLSLISSVGFLAFFYTVIFQSNVE
ncbi:MAG: hypothetical protein D3919_12100 [Candidatus Electrothrix sp. AW5]|nr:hypothetical protein [Candidatus Electrothrix gigas]